MSKPSPTFCLCVLSLCALAMITNEAQAYTHEVRQSGSSYIWRVNNVDQGSTSNLAQAIMNTMGSNREIHILASGTITQTINVSASGVRLHFHNNTLTGGFSGSGIINNGHSGFEIYDLILRNISNGYGIRCSAASNLRFVNVRVIDIAWIGIRIDSRTSNPWNYTINNLYMRDCRFENCGSHGLETYSIDGITLEGTMTARNCGECGVLLNQTRNGTIASVDAYNCNWGGGYAGLRYANACSNITTNYLKADRCGRGFFIVQSGPTVNCHLNNAEIYECSGLGIWIENGSNCSVKAGCSESPVSVSGSGSYANVSSSCSGGGGATYYKIQNRGTGLVLDGMGRTVNGDACGQYANSTTHFNAQWERISVGNYYQFRNRGTGLFLDGMGRTANGSDVGQWANTTHNNSQWSVQQYSGSYYRIQNRGTGLYLDGMGRTANGSACGQYANTTHVNAQWQLISVSSSGARIAGNDEIASIEESELAIVHPNPATDEITITLPSTYEGEKIVNLHDELGRVAATNSFHNAKHTMYVGNLPPGLYVLKIVNNRKMIVEKVIKR